MGAALITYSLVPFATLITGGIALPVIGFIAAGTAVGTGVCKDITKPLHTGGRPYMRKATKDRTLVAIILKIKELPKCL